MPVSKKQLQFKRNHLAGLLLITFISVIFVAFGMTGNEDYDFARREMSLRRIGHEILLQSGDSVSRVMPVKRISKNEYQVSFEKPFSFQPDSLVHTTRRLLSNEANTSDYVVSVLNCDNSTVAYGYAVSGNKKDDIITCLGRTQPIACYILNIKFKPAERNTAKKWYLLGSLALLAVLGYLLFKPAKPRTILSEDQSVRSDGPPASSQDRSNIVFTLGSMSFDAESRKIITNEKTIELTKTETRVLSIFALTPNEIIERNRLQKEIWEDEGVIVGRSLDMFISKLRKKLESDPNVKIVVIRGKGYKLEVSS